MFGHQNDDSSQQDQSASNPPLVIPDEATTSAAVSDQPVDTSTAAPEAQASATDSFTPEAAMPAAPADSAAAPPAADDSSPQGSDDPAWQHPGTPLNDTQPINDVISPAGGFPKPPSFPAAALHTAVGTDDSTFVGADDSTTHELIDVKQQALGELSPLIDQLNQTPEERFRTLMMMIQASDDQHLIKDAFTAAHNIEDEKARAQALLDVVNEINYFTQQPAAEAQPEA